MTKSQPTHHDGSRKHTRRIAGILKVVLVVAGVVGASVPAMAGKAKEASGTAGGEISPPTGLQSLGIPGGTSSDVMGCDEGDLEIIVGAIEQIERAEVLICTDTIKQQGRKTTLTN